MKYAVIAAIAAASGIWTQWINEITMGSPNLALFGIALWGIPWIAAYLVYALSNKERETDIWLGTAIVAVFSPAPSLFSAAALSFVGINLFA